MPPLVWGAIGFPSGARAAFQMHYFFQVDFTYKLERVWPEVLHAAAGAGMGGEDKAYIKHLNIFPLLK